MIEALKRYEHVPPEVFEYLKRPFPDYLDKKVEVANLAKLYFLTRGRNAWNSTWVNQYSNSSVFVDLLSAQNAAEKQRTQGTVFYIEDVLSIVLRTSTHSLAILEINNFGELRRLSDLPVRRYSISQIGSHFSSARTDSVAAFWAPNGNLEAPAMPFVRRRSIPQGSQWPLYWEPSNKPVVDVETAEKIANQIMIGMTVK